MQETSVVVKAGLEKCAYLVGIFTVGERLGMRLDNPLMPVEVVEVGVVASIRVPSGRLMVDTPWPQGRPGRELVERIPAGTYEVEASWVEAPYEFMGEQFDGRECAAVRLRVRDEPVSVWEIALGVDDEAERPVPGEAGFETDTAMGAFADAASWQALTQPFRRFWERTEQQPGVAFGRDTESLRCGEFEKVADDATRADLLSFPAQEGLTAVWIGRNAAGQVVTVAVAPPLSCLA
ncbi:MULTISPECIES: DUF4241 domain-containing protein [unclassified Streptomyces]|uniref:DUF4241 domain-containing protein n=1 Tax=unclassified Streptomyces TaxID=2593676 RepID=UPI0033C0774F